MQIDPLGRVTSWVYDGSGDLTQQLFADGSIQLAQYDSTFHETTQSTNSLGQTTSATYDHTTGLMTSSTDATGGTTTYAWANGRLQSETGPLGRTQLFRYDGDLRQIAASDALGNWSLTGYDGNGNVNSMTDALGWVTQMTNNAKGMPVLTVDANGAPVQTAYNAQENTVSQTDARGYTETTTIDARGLTTGDTDYLGNQTTEAYDAAGNRTSETDANGNQTVYAFDVDNRVTSQTDPLGNKTQYQYDADANVTTLTDPNNHTATSAYDLRNREVLTIDPLGHAHFNVVDPASNIIGSIDEDGGVTRQFFDADGRLIVRMNALGNAFHYVYDAAGDQIQQIDPRGEPTTTLVDADGRPAALIDPDGNVSRNGYNARGDLVQMIDANGHDTAFTFNAVGGLIASTDALGDQTQSVFDVTGALWDTIDANGNVSKFTNDGDNRPVVETDPTGHATRLAYDAAGNTIQSVDASGYLTRNQFYSDNQMIGTLDANGHQSTTVYTKQSATAAVYDGNGNGDFNGYSSDNQQTGNGLPTGAGAQKIVDDSGKPEQTTDPVANNTYYLQDLIGDRVGILDPLGHATYFVYNADGQAVQRVDADGRTINDTYDPAGRVTQEIWLAPGGAQTNAITYNYDAVGNLKSASNSYGSYSFTYDAANRPLTQTDPFALTLTFGHDHSGNTTSVQDSAGGSVTSVFDADNRLTSRRFSGGPNGAQLRIDIGYTPDGQMASETRYADTAGTQLLGQTTEQYDGVGNVTQIQDTNAANTVLLKFAYQYDAGNNLTSETDTVNGTPTTTTDGNDSTGQLTSSGGTTFSFDLNGNRLQTILNGKTTNYKTGVANEMTSDGTWNFKYDAAGNLIEADGIANGLVWKYTFDNLNHLLTASEYTSGGALQEQETNAYDPFGNPIEQDEYTASNGQTTVTRFANQVMGLGPTVPGRDGLAPAWADLNGSNQIQVRRLYLDTTDALFARIGSDGTEAWYLPDRLGSIRGLMNNSGSLVDSITYDAWGNVTNESSPANGDRFKFGGGQLDATTSLELFGTRWYSPADGVWVSADPLGLAAGLNPYRYGFNQPTARPDVTGMDGPNDVHKNFYAWWDVAMELRIMAGFNQAQIIAAIGDMPPRPAATFDVVACASGAVSGGGVGAVVGSFGSVPGAVIGGVGGAVLGCITAGMVVPIWVGSEASLWKRIMAAAVLGGYVGLITGVGGAYLGPRLFGAGARALSPARNSINYLYQQIQRARGIIQQLENQRQVLLNSAPSNIMQEGGYAAYITARVEAIDAAIAAQEEEIETLWTFIDLLLPG